MALAVSELEEILDALEHLDSAYIRFLSTSRVDRIDEVIQLQSPWDPLPGARDIFAGRLLTFGWSSSRSDTREPALLDLRFQISGVHEWPHTPVVGLWQHADKETIGGVLLVDGYVLGERYVYDARSARGQASCTTVRVAVPTARLLQGPS